MIYNITMSWHCCTEPHLYYIISPSNTHVASFTTLSTLHTITGLADTDSAADVCFTSAHQHCYIQYYCYQEALGILWSKTSTSLYECQLCLGSFRSVSAHLMLKLLQQKTLKHHSGKTKWDSQNERVFFDWNNWWKQMTLLHSTFISLEVWIHKNVIQLFIHDVKNYIIIIIRTMYIEIPGL